MIRRDPLTSDAAQYKDLSCQITASFFKNSWSLRQIIQLLWYTKVISVQSLNTYQALSRDIIAGLRMSKACARSTDSTNNSTINSPVPWPTRLQRDEIQ